MFHLLTYLLTCLLIYLFTCALVHGARTCASGVKMSVALHVSERPSTKVRFSSFPTTFRRSPPNRNTWPPPVAVGPGESSDSLDDPEQAERGVSNPLWSCWVASRANELASCIASSIFRSSAADNCRIPPPLEASFDGIIYNQRVYRSMYPNL